MALNLLARKFALFYSSRAANLSIHKRLRLVTEFLLHFWLNLADFWRPIMSVMKDITNLSPIAQDDSHESSPERDIFVSYVAPTSRRKRNAKQAALERFFQTSTPGETSSEEEKGTKSENEAEEEANLAFMTPESEPKKKANPPKRKRLRLGGKARNGEVASPALSVTLNGLTKAQLVELVNTLVSERHPDLEQVDIALTPYLENDQYDCKENFK